MNQQCIHSEHHYITVLAAYHTKINTATLQDVLISTTVIHAVTSMCEVTLLLQHVRNPVTQCDTGNMGRVPVFMA